MPEITIPAFDGRSFTAYLARPQHSSAPGIVVCQEIFGVNAAMRQLCDDLANQGYLAICPDLFWRQQPGIQLTDKTEAEMQQAFKLFEGFNSEIGIVDLLATLGQLRKLPECNGATGTVGYCLGGKMAFLMMTRSDIDCGVSYYGVGLEKHLSETADIRRPLLMHMAENDAFVPPETRARIMRGIHKNPQITAVLYPGVDHAFARPGGVHYNADAATQAGQRTAAFFSAHLNK